MKNALLWAPLIIFAIFVGMFASGLFKPDDRNINSRMVGNPLPAFALPAAASDRPGLTSRDFADGQPRLLNVFGSWCVPCAAEAPQLMVLKARGVQIDALAIRDARPDVDRFLARWGNPYAKIGLDARSSVQMDIGSSGVPETFVIDGRGIIRYQHIGYIGENDVATILDKVRAASVADSAPERSSPMKLLGFIVPGLIILGAVIGGLYAIRRSGGGDKKRATSS